MELQEVEVIIDRNGEVRIEVQGVKGRACLELTEDLVEALGGKVAEQELTAEAYEEDRARTVEITRVRR